MINRRNRKSEAPPGAPHTLMAILGDIGLSEIGDETRDPGGWYCDVQFNGTRAAARPVTAL